MLGGCLLAATLGVLATLWVRPSYIQYVQMYTSTMVLDRDLPFYSSI